MIADSDSFTFDDASRLLTAVSGRYNNTVAFQYGDGAGRRTSEALTVNLGQARTYRTTHRYDVVGRIVDINYPDQWLVTRSYTDRNELAEVSWASDWLVRYEYDSNGFRKTRTRADAHNKSTNYMRYVNGTAIGNLVGSMYIEYESGTEVYQYAYDANKNVTSEQITSPMTAYGMGVVSPGGYDAEDRLRAWLRGDGLRRQDWMLSSTGDWSGFVDQGQLVNYHGDASHQLTSAGNYWQYDPKGNLTLDAWNKQHHYAWDFDNRLKAADVDGQEGNEIAYTYDALGRRVSKSITVGLGTETPSTTTTVFVCRTEPLAHSPYAGQEVAEYAVDAATSDPLRKFVYGVYIDEPLVMIDRTAAGVLPAGEDERFYYHQNNNHNVVALTNQAGDVVERCSYTPYGQATFHDPATGVALAPQPAASPLGNPFLYTGRRLDSETGLHYYRARQYSSAQGRFLGRDPVEADINLYRYCENNPTTRTDPSGLDAPGSWRLWDSQWFEEERKKAREANDKHFAASLDKLKQQLLGCCPSQSDPCRAACEKELDRTVAGLRKAYQKIYDIGEPRRFRYSGPVCDDCEKLVHSNVSAGTEDSYFGYNSAAAYRVFPFTELEVPFTGHCWGEITCKKTDKVFTIDFWKGETDFWRDGMDAFGWKALRR